MFPWSQATSVLHGFEKGNMALRSWKLIVMAAVALASGSWIASAQTITTLWRFTRGSDGANPGASLLQAADGYFYGTTAGGGNTNLNSGSGFGTVYRVGSDGNFTNIYAFHGSTDGGNPEGLVQGTDGCFYGATENKGTNGYGTVFRLSPTGTLTTLWSFSGGPDGAHPYATLALGTDGSFYGTASAGGTSMNCVGGCGTIFRISGDGSFTNLHSFSFSDGAFPHAGLVKGMDGNFYGTTAYGGVFSNGTVFMVTPSGGFTSLHSFEGSDGAAPYGGMTLGSDGSFYGATTQGASSNSVGGVFRMTPDGVITNLHAFTRSDGSTPFSKLIQGSDGSFYGTTSYGGMSNNGTLFRINVDGSFATLYSFAGGDDGARPSAGLIQGNDGSFYGTGFQGGTNNAGTVFRLSVPLNPPANQISAIQPTGSDLCFSIPSVAGETYQLQFTTDLASGIWSNVPGASVTNSIGALLTLTNLGGALAPQGFYRFDITP